MLVKIENDRQTEYVNPANVTKIFPVGQAHRVNLNDGSYLVTREPINSLVERLNASYTVTV